MSSSPGPIPMPKGRAGPKLLPPGIHFGLPRSVQGKDAPELRRPPAPPQRSGVMRSITPQMLTDALDAVDRGQGTNLPTSGQGLSVCLAPVVREVILRSGLEQVEIQRFQHDLAEVLSNPEFIALLPRWSEHLEFSLYWVDVMGPRFVDVFRFAVFVKAEQQAIVAACEHSRRDRR